MRLVKTRIKGFQSFDDSGDVEFTEGINLVIGQNNAGKSALLRALLPTLPDDRHTTPEKWEHFRLPIPVVELTVEVNVSEIYDWMLLSGNPQFFPIPNNVGDAQAFMQQLHERPTISIFAKHSSRNNSFDAPYPSHGLFDQHQRAPKSCMTFLAENGELRSARQERGEDSLPILLWAAWERNMFYFAPERMTIGEAPSGYANRLAPNARNLPNVLHMLANESGDIFQELVQHLRDIFPTVGNISVRTKPDNGHLEVRVWPTESMRRVELSFPLNSSGTGVSQVIALLTTIMTMDRTVIIIDEINSFLHPAAVKGLLRILQARYNQHQYIISTHAPEVIGFSNPKTLHLVKRARYNSSVERLDLNEVGKLREVAEHLGVSMADVFAADRVIWVEGPTEELCFPFLHQQLTGPLPRGTIFTSVASTGDFNTKRRDPAIVYEVYSRLSSAAATLVVSVAFSFDTETLTTRQKEKMRRNSGGFLHFLPRRHFECYLVDPVAIAAFIVSKDAASNQTISPE